MSVSTTVREQQDKRSDIILIGILFLISVVFFFHRLGTMALIGPDEPRYAQVAREMLERRDVITPTIGGQPWFEKPALLYWTMMAGMSVFGVNEFAVRLPSALAAIITALILYFVGRRMVSSFFGFLTAAVFIANPMAFAFSRGATTDMLLCLTMTAGLCLFFCSELQVEGGSSQVLVLGAYACFGLAALAKGLVGVALPAGIILTYRMVARQGFNLRGLFIGRGLIVFVIVCASWYAPVIARHGGEFVQEFFIGHHFERFTSNKYRHPGPIYYYLPVLLVGSFPWTPFLIASLFRFRLSEFRREGKTDTTDESLTDQQCLNRLRIFSLIWLVVPLVFFSLSGSKLPGYLLPAMPGAFFLISSEIHRLGVLAESDRLGRLLFASVAVLLVGVGVAATSVARNELGPTQFHLAVAAMLVIAAVVVGWLSFRLRLLTAFGVIVSGCALAGLVVTTAYQPLIEKRESFWDFAHVARRELRDGERLVGYYDYHHSLTFYTNARSVFDRQGNVVVLHSPEELTAFVNANGTVLLFMSERAFADLGRDRRFKTILRWRDRGWVLVRCG
jgi:4-amino-4-deoxy-L-arabinose transferase-like glycosyltransferase